MPSTPEQSRSGRGLVTVGVLILALFILIRCSDSVTGKWEPGSTSDPEFLDGTAGTSRLDSDRAEVLRPDFSTGKFLNSIGLDDAVRSVILLPDGKFYAGGRTTGTSGRFAVARFTPEGQLDTSFATTGGAVINAAANADSMAHAIATDSQGKIIAVGRAHNGNYYRFAVARVNTNGILDTSFGTNGIIVTGITSYNNLARAVVVQPDNKIIAAGYAATSAGHTNYDLALVRFNTTGSIDSTFNSNGRIITSVSVGDDVIYAAVADAQGRTVVGGYGTPITSDQVFAVARYTTAGLIDSTFGSNGRRMINVSSIFTDVINGMAVAPDGKIIAAGYAKKAAPFYSDIAVVRLTTTGALDTTFGTGGIRTTDYALNRDEYARQVYAMSDGKIIVAGWAATAPGVGEHTTVARYTTAGALDTSFSTVGYVVTSLSTTEDEGLAIDYRNGAILVGGRTMANARDYMAIVRYNVDGSIASSGSLDKSFGASGFTLNTFASQDSVALTGVVDNDQKIIAAGVINDDMGVARYTTDGLLDSTFGSQGQVQLAIGSDGSEALSVAATVDNRLVLAGRTNSIANKIAMARLTTAGALDASFAGTGTLVSSFGLGDNVVHEVKTQSDGKILINGFAFDSFAVASRHAFAVGRLNTNGTFDSTFSSNGRLIVSVGIGSAASYGSAVQVDNKLVVAGYAYTSLGFDFAMARFTTAGVLDSSNFGTVGRNIVSVGTGSDFAQAMTMQADGKLVAAGGAAMGTIGNIGLVRLNTTGLVDSTTFGTNGRTITSIGTVNDVANSVVVQSNGKILIAGFTDTGLKHNVVVARYLSTGLIDTTFGGRGYATTSLDTRDDEGNKIFVDAQGRYIVVGRSLGSAASRFAIMRFWP